MTTDHIEPQLPDRIFLHVDTLKTHHGYLYLPGEEERGDIEYARVGVAGAAPTVDELQRELAFYFGQHHSTLNHREDALRCMVNDCVRVRNLCLTQSHVDTLSAGSGKDAPDA